MPLSRARLFQLVGFLSVWGLIVVLRLGQIQLANHDEYVARAVRQQERTLSLTPVRGSIYDTKGRILAESVAAESIYADPQAVTDPVLAARRLAAISGLELTQAELRKKLTGRSEFAWIARQVEADVARDVRKLSIPGIYTLEEHRRAYPRGALAANVLGYVGLDGEGLAGIEHSFDRFVRGKPGKVTLLRDARRAMYVVGAEGANAPVDGLSVYLTIDEVIQFIAERALANAIQQYKAAAGSVLVMDPRSGDILAMASAPRFDPNHYRDSPPASWRNRPVQDLYEPGSTFKIVTAAAGLEEGLVTPSQILDCGMGKISIGNVHIKEHGNHRYGYMSFEDVMSQSSNVGTIRVGLSLGQSRLYRYIRAFGFGQRSGVELPGEGSGILRKPEQWSALSNAILSIGQEIAVTPLQIAAATATIANGGLLVTPRIVSKVVNAEGKEVRRPAPPEPRRVVSERTAAVLNEILKTVVSRGTGVNASLPEFVVAGKTGTAQKASRGGYSADRFVASFVGYVPADRPRLVILVVIDEPRTAQYGGTVAAPLFREIARTSLRYLGVSPSIPNRQVIARAVTLAPLNRSLQTTQVSGTVPDFRGLDARTAIARATTAGFRVRTSGLGIVDSQRPAPGEQLQNNRDMTLSMTAGEREALR
ncbi:MAG TPA: penicillin-binding transpeptidase domain-containing protein [Thermoanaerobaculia bacterium]|nr:penicillin-binding transpeptidase domain-containing protein [Thermoanaerobaculia bacterium]